MPELVVNNINIVVERRHKRGVAGQSQSDPARALVNGELVRQVESLARQVKDVCCSSSWMEECLYRGVKYAPDFRCRCPRCTSKFPDRLHPRPARQSDFSQDCQAEMDDDPEFAEELARLRNDRDRVGSVFMGSRVDRNVGRSRRGAP